MEEVSKIEQILLQDPHIVGIEHAENWQFHEIDYAIFKCHRERVADYIKDIQGSLQRPPIFDNFTDYSLREEWRKIEVPRKYGNDAAAYLARNGLRNYSNMIIYHSTDVINESNYCGTNPDTFKELLDDVRRTHAKLVEQTGSVTRVELVKDLRQKTYALLEFLSQQSPT